LEENKKSKRYLIVCLLTMLYLPAVASPEALLAIQRKFR
jgi:hypothetical protein